MLSNLLIKIIVLFLPTQLGLHFWPAFSRVGGIKVDYLSPTLYLTDIFLVILIILNLNRICRFVKSNVSQIFIFISFVVLNLVFSVFPLNSLFWWLRLILYLLTYLTFRLRSVTWEQIRKPLLISTSIVVGLETAQLIYQSSIGGIFYYLGERYFSFSTPGIGRLNLLGQEFLRPTSTFSHANSLAGYLLVVFYLFSKKQSSPWQKIVPFIGVLLTFSKTAILGLAIIIFNLRPEITLVASLLLTLSQATLHNLYLNSQSISDRLFFFDYQNKITRINPLTGVGLGNFIPSLGKLLPGSFLTPSKLQPIHNLLYLLFSEVGLLGSILLLLSLLKKKALSVIVKPEVLGLIALLVFTGVFDHYSWTLPQNKLIFLLALAIMF